MSEDISNPDLILTDCRQLSKHFPNYHFYLDVALQMRVFVCGAGYLLNIQVFISYNQGDWNQGIRIEEALHEI